MHKEFANQQEFKSHRPVAWQHQEAIRRSTTVEMQHLVHYPRLPEQGKVMRFVIATTCGALVGLIAGSIAAHYKESQGLLDANNESVAAHTVSQNCLSCHISPPTYIQAVKQYLVPMQVFTAEFADSTLRPVNPPVRIGDTAYTVELEASGGLLIGRLAGREVKYSMQYVIGGKQIYYFLTMPTVGELQVLPLAFDVRMRCWLPFNGDGHVQQFGSAARGPSGQSGALALDTACGECHDFSASYLTLRSKRPEMREAAVKY